MGQNSSLIHTRRSVQAACYIQWKHTVPCTIRPLSATCSSNLLNTTYILCSEGWVQEQRFIERSVAVLLTFLPHVPLCNKSLLSLYMSAAHKTDTVLHFPRLTINGQFGTFLFWFKKSPYNTCYSCNKMWGHAHRPNVDSINAAHISDAAKATWDYFISLVLYICPKPDRGNTQQASSSRCPCWDECTVTPLPSSVAGTLDT